MSTVETRARRAYEWARLRRALLASIPVTALVTVSMLLVTRPDRAGWVGVAVVLVGVWALWRGVGLPQAFAAGVISGLIPLLAVSAAMKAPHVCGAGMCWSVCLPAAGVGGVFAGIVLAAWRRRLRFSPSARSVALGFVVMVLTGAMACACIGFTGVAILSVSGGLAMVLARGRVS